ncbi:MAG TPA: DNA polymerase III subunit delta [Acidimicrobiia bacterium]
MSVHVVRGDDPILREEVVARLVGKLVGDDDRTLALEELTVPGRAGAGEGDDDEPGGAEGRGQVVAAALNSVQSPPFMTGRRVVVLRDAGNLAAADAEPLIAYLADPMESTALVFVAGGGRLPANLTKALKTAKAAEVGPRAEKTADVLAQHARDAELDLRPDARQRVTEHLGEDAGRVPGLVEVLAAAFGTGAAIGADDVEPYLGGAGAVPGYELTNAIEAGDVPGALATLHRMTTATGPRQARPMHPLQVLGLLQSYYRRILRLDDPDLRGPSDAVAALGGRVKEYPARKALEQARALRADGLRQAYDHLAQADLDLKGKRAIPQDAVLEVLVARLARLSGQARGGRRRASR